jgi:ankyrin repeat protein
MRQAIPVEEWAKEPLSKYGTQINRIWREFTRRHEYGSEEEFHYIVCPYRSDHLVLHRTYLVACILHQNHYLLRKALTDAGLDVNARGMYDVGYRTPLAIAVDRNREAVQILIDHGADIHVLDRTGSTPLDHAVESTGLLLIKYGARPWAKTRRYYTTWIKRVERTILLLHEAPLPKDIIRHIFTFIK